MRQLIASVAPTIWINQGILSSAEVATLRDAGLNVTIFTEALSLTESSVASALDTIAEHHPGARIWVESLVRTYDLDRIVALLHLHAQRATYGAVAGLLGVIPRSLMQNRDKCFRDSWVVSADTQLPSGYEPDQIDPRLTENELVLSTPTELGAWLRGRT